MTWGKNFCLLLFFTFLVFNLFSQDASIFEMELDPQEQLTGLRNNQVTLTLPGSEPMTFQLKKNRTLAPSVQREMKDIRTFDLIKYGKFVGTYTWSPVGVWYTITREEVPMFIYPEFQKGNNIHTVELGHHATIKEPCAYDEVMAHFHEHPEEYEDIKYKGSQKQMMQDFGSDLREYRVAIVTTGEFYELNGRSIPNAQAVIASTFNGLNAIYGGDLSVSFRVIGSQIYTNSASDPFDPANGGRTTQASEVVALNFASSTYDIGHALHRSQSGDGWSSGGVAQLRSVCRGDNSSNPQSKAAGWSGSFNNSGSGWLGLIAHELGHQFGAQHTFGGEGGSCQDNITLSNAYEIGSGTTIMSYNGICDPSQNIPGSGAADNYFNVASLEQMIDHILGVGDCAAKTASNNASPVVNPTPCGATYTMPKSTPFYLNGEASDPDGDELLYCWEQFDVANVQGAIGARAAVQPRGPLMRSFPPTSASDRYFPTLGAIKNGNSSDPFQVLPGLPRALNFKLTVRDDNADGSAISIQPMSITVENSGPLSVDNPGTSWTTGDLVPITWSVSGSGSLCDKADILLSVDGGDSFPFTLADDVDYAAGAFDVLVTGLYPTTNEAVVMVKCDDYECFFFFDTNNTPFSITSTCDAPSSALCPAIDIQDNAGEPSLILTDQQIIVGSPVNSITRNVNASSNALGGVFWNTAMTGCGRGFNSARAEYIDIQVTETGSYDFSVNTGDNGVFTVFDRATFSESNPCASFISSTATLTNTGSINFTSSISIDLQACVPYRIALYKINSSGLIEMPSLNGPGVIIEEDPSPDPDYSTAYMVVNRETNIIVDARQDADFTSLPGGLYTVYGVMVKSSGPSPPNITDLSLYIGEEFNRFYIPGDCFLTSANSFNLDLDGECSITSLTLGAMSGCNPLNSTYTQEITVTYDVIPPGAQLNIAGTVFDATSSPQTETVTLISDGQLFMGNAFFTTEPNCKNLFEIMAPDNCCPFMVELGDSLSICEGEGLVLDAGPGGQDGSYEWSGPSGPLPDMSQTLFIEDGGTYSVIVTNGTGCQRSDDIFLEEVRVPFLNASDDVTICQGSPTVLGASTNAPNIRFILLPNDTLADGRNRSLTVNVGGIYLVETYFGDDCPARDSVIVTARPAPEPDLGDDVFLCEGEMVTLDGTSNGIEFQWFKDDVAIPGATGQTLDVTESGTYRIEALNDGGCPGSDEVVVSVEGIPSLTVSPDVTICDGEPTVLEAFTSASLVQFYLDGNLIQSGPQTTYTAVMGGSYTIEAGNSDNCKVSEMIEVTAKDSPRPRLGFDQLLCEGEEARLSTGVNDGTFTWTKDNIDIMVSDSFIVVNETGIYGVTIENAEGCTGTDEVSIEVFPDAVINAGVDAVFCEGESAQIIASSSSQVFFWTKDGQPYPEIDLVFNVTEPGTYVLEARNEADCAVFDTVVISENPLPVVDLGDDRVSCIGNEITLAGPSGDFTYQWFRDGIQFSTRESIDITDNGLYVLIVSDNNDCSAEDNVTITFEPGPTLSINADQAEICEGDQYTATITTNATDIVWFKDGNIIAGETGTDLIISESGTYTAQAEGTGGCIVDASVDVTVNPVPNVQLDGQTVDCEGSTITLDAGVMAISYTWTLNGNVVGNTQTIDVDQAGTYIVEVTNQFNCSASSSTEVSFVSRPTIDLDADAQFCEGSEVTITATSTGSSYQWSLNGVEIAGATSSTITVDEAGTYTLLASGAGGCEEEASIEVTLVASPNVDLGADISLCPGEMVTIDAGSGVGLTYSWSTGESGASIIVMNDNVTSQTTQTISVEVANATNCSSTDELIVTFEPIIDATLTASAAGVCGGDTVTLVVDGGTMYDWDGPANTFDVLSANSIQVYPSELSTYAVTVTDDCPNNEDIETIEIDVFTASNATAGNDTSVLLGRSINLNASGGVSYQWEADPSFVGSRTGANPEVMPEVPTTYRVTITDENGCTKEDEVTVSIIEDPLSVFKAVTAISPNDDGANDKLTFQGLEAYPDNKIVIYNRWGNVVFEKSGYQTDDVLFDGSANGDLLPADTYYYVLEFEGFVIKETLTIVRPN